MKKPHGTPSKACPITRTSSDSAWAQVISWWSLKHIECACTHKKGDEDSGIHEDQGQDGRPAVTQAVGDGSSQEDTHKSTALTGLEEGALPFGSNGIGSVALQFAISFLKGFQSDKVTVQKHVERFHDLIGVRLVSFESTPR